MAEERVQRRLAAILAADVAGYSRLMGVDEEGTLSALKELRRELAGPKIKEHRGASSRQPATGCSSSSQALSCAQGGIGGGNVVVAEE
jgi:adenylate cyclase